VTLPRVSRGGVRESKEGNGRHHHLPFLCEGPLRKTVGVLGGAERGCLLREQRQCQIVRQTRVTRSLELQSAAEAASLSAAHAHAVFVSSRRAIRRSHPGAESRSLGHR
jgi:hypothetical protein